VVAFSTFTFWLGYIAWGAGLFPLGEPSVSGNSVLPLSISLRALGWVCLAVLGLYLAWCATGWSVKSFRPPPLPLALAQIALAIGRTALTGGVLYVLLWGMPRASYFEVLGAFVLTIAAGGLGMVPGAAGVLEAVALLVLSSSIPTAAVVGALLVFRAIYYLLPLAASAGTFAVVEARRWREED
jgi:glycosyltransferase 2 family protein